MNERAFDPSIEEDPAATPRQAAVSCRGVSKIFGSGDTATVALNNIDCDIEEGGITLLAGPSGCGKTTLISIIAGLLNPGEGEVCVFGRNLQHMDDDELVDFRARNIGFVFQSYNLLPSLTAAENAAIPLLVENWNRKKALVRAAEVLETVGLGNRINSYPNQMSGGQQQRVVIARALVHDPRLLVCDEPTAALDAHSGHTVMELFRSLAVRPGRVVIIVTHDHRVLEFGDRIVRMSDGRIES
jgi:putative ABC transport system ATP-binding protein